MSKVYKRTYKKKPKARTYSRSRYSSYDYQPRRVKVVREKKEKAPGAISTMGGELGSMAGSAIPIVGPAIGRFLGGKLGHLVEKVTGFGDYRIQNNSIMKGGMSVPQIVNSVDNGSVIVRHREFLRDIPSSTNFEIQKFVINPGLIATFPWLSQMANSYEQYRLRGVLFEFNSTSSDAILSTATSSSLGTVIMCTDYDIADPQPTNKREMLTNEFSCSQKPSNTFIHPIECKKSQTAQNILYTRGIAVPAGYDPRLYDFANFYIATEGMQGAVGNVGELWVTYEIEFFKPQYSFISLTDHFRMVNPTENNPFGTPVGDNAASGGTLGGSIGNNRREYYFPPNVSNGKYLFNYTISGTVVGAAMPSLGFINCATLTILNNNSVGVITVPNPAAVNSRCSLLILVQVNAQNASIKLNESTGVIPADGYGDLFVTRIPDQMTV